MKHIHLNDSGRSMTEMLATLVIMGILSGLGIYGFQVAITKMRANELINESNKRALMVATQLQMNRASNLNGFTQNDFGYGIFTPNPILAQNGQFKIGIEGVSQNVCAQMQSVVGGIIQSFSPDSCTDTNTILLTYNNDLSEPAATGNNASGGNSAREPLPEDGPTTDDDSTCSGERKGECQVCNNGTYIDSDAYCLTHGGGMCVDGECKKLHSNCMSNGDCRTIAPEKCANGECYCNFNNDQVNAITGPTIFGRCELKTTRLKGTALIDGHTYLWGGTENFDWWSAKNFCAAYGKRMMSLAELGCEAGEYCREDDALFTKIRKKLSDTLSSFTYEIQSEDKVNYVRWNQWVEPYTRACSGCNVICY